VRFRIERGGACAERGCLGGHFAARAAGCQATEYVIDGWRGLTHSLEAQRTPDAVLQGKAVAARHHPDDLERRTADAQHLADRIRRAIEAVLPEIVADDHYVRCVATLIGHQERAA